MSSKIDNPQTRALCDAFLSLENRDECFRLLEDLFTMREIRDMAQRLEVAKLLAQKTTYADIAEMTGVSSATIGRVNRALSYGEGGYELVLNRITNKEDNHG